METVENSYCRFCAEPKSSEKLLNVLGECAAYKEVMRKLNFLNAIYIDVTNCDSLPKTVCFVCYDSLNKAYEFLESVKRAQDVLVDIFITNEGNKYGPTDDDILDDILSPEPLDEEIPEVKIETVQENAYKLEVVVKNELKEEKENDDLSYTNTLNVQELFDVALRNEPFTSSMALFKENSDTEREINNWSEYPWVCGFCSMEFISLDMLRSHVKIVHDKCCAHFCVDCDTSVKDDFNVFIRHVRKHRKCLRNFCYYCNKEFDTLTDVNLHIEQHLQKPKTRCSHCGEIFANEEMLTVHIHQYASDNKKPKRRPRRKPGTPITIEELTCHICRKVYKNPNSLRDHMKLHTTDRKRDYTCERCGKTFYNKGTLTSHIMSHDKIRPHVCKICNRSFLFPNMLRRHVEMHSGAKPFSCEQCGRNFRLQYQLNAHKIVHTDAMPYSCQYCNKKFRFKQIMKNHERQHTGAKPYSCQNCGMEFTNWSNYNKHMKRRHNMDMAKKKITPQGVFPINPETGQIIQVVDPVGTEEWKSKIMLPCKRGKKRSIKHEKVE